jgi:hypothetical protein
MLNLIEISRSFRLLSGERLILFPSISFHKGSGLPCTSTQEKHD